MIFLPKNVVPSKEFVEQLLALSDGNRFDNASVHQTEEIYSLLKRYERKRYTRQYLKYQWTSLCKQVGPSQAFDTYKEILILRYRQHCFREKLKAMKFPKGFWDD